MMFAVTEEEGRGRCMCIDKWQGMVIGKWMLKKVCSDVGSERGCCVLVMDVRVFYTLCF